MGSMEEGEQKDCWSVGRSQQSSQEITAAIQRLGVRLLQNLETTPDQPNVIISPFSISLALSQLALGECVLLHLLKYFWHQLFSTSSFLHNCLETVPVIVLLCLAGAVNETKELLMHHLHENTLPCYQESLHNAMNHLQNNDLQIATRIFLRQG